MIELDDIKDPGLLQLIGCIRLIVREELQAANAGAAVVADPTRPLTAEELCVRWKIKGATDAQKLHNLNYKANSWGLRPLEGTRGWEALYAFDDVLHAEAFASGKTKRRKNAA